MDNTKLLEVRANKDQFFGSSDMSPIPHADRHAWRGLNYFDPDQTLSFTLLIAPADGSTLSMQTSDGQERIYRRAGVVTFEVEGQTASLTLLQTEEESGLFLPFRDSTSGNESYGSGRYLDLEENQDGTVTVDFNYAYNPFCAYSDAYSCPLPPVENWLKVPIRAGEADYR